MKAFSIFFVLIVFGVLGIALELLLYAYLGIIGAYIGIGVLLGLVFLTLNYVLSVERM